MPDNKNDNSEETAVQGESVAHQAATTSGSPGLDPRQEQSAQVYVTTKVFYQAIIVVSLVASALSTVVYDRYFATKVAVFDLPGYLMSVREKMALAGNAANAEQILVAGLNEAEKIVKSVPNNYVVISGDAVLGDSKPALVLYRYPKKPQMDSQSPAVQQPTPAPGTPAE